MAIVRGLHHASFSVHDLARARRFYGEILGLEEIARPGFPFDGTWYRAGDSQVHLIVAPPEVDLGARPPRPHPLAPHTAFAIDDYDAVRTRLKTHGLEPIEAPAFGQMWVADPDGHVIELIAPVRP